MSFSLAPLLHTECALGCHTPNLGTPCALNAVQNIVGIASHIERVAHSILHIEQIVGHNGCIVAIVGKVLEVALGTLVVTVGIVNHTQEVLCVGVVLATTLHLREPQ